MLIELVFKGDKLSDVAKQYTRPPNEPNKDAYTSNFGNSGALS
jgi:hypothetical protein